jgi:tetratricopeptide (TPR) repeat protein
MKFAKAAVLLAFVFFAVSGLHAQIAPRRQAAWQQAGPDNIAFDRIDPFAAMRREAAVNPAPTPGGIVAASQLHIPGKALKEYQRSEKAYNSGDLASSVAHLQKALGIYPQFVGAHNALGLRYVQSHEYEKALGEHQSALALSPADSDAHSDLSLDLLLLNRYSEAEAEARYALQLAPQATGPRYVLGRALIAQLQVTPEAIRMLSESQDAFPNASLVLAQLHFVLGNADETIKDLRHYLRNPAQNDNKHKAECWLARLSGETPDASCSDAPGRPSFK